MSGIPMDLIGDIFSRLPVKSLVRFRCISKLIRTLIDDRYFIKSHIDRSIKTKKNHNLILRQFDDLSSVSFDSLDVAIQLEPPFRNSDCEVKFFGCCRGLMCLGTEDHNVVIWNPATRKYRRLPVAPIQFLNIHEISFHIGYDLATDDYKVVRIVNFTSKKLDSEARVFSLKLNSWKIIEDFPSQFRLGQWDIMHACGSLHWILRGDRDEPIGAFDLATEKYEFLPKPEFQGSPEGSCPGEFEGCFCLCLNYEAVCVDLWVMKEYKVKDSWTLLYTISNTYPELSFNDVDPLMYSKSYHKVLMAKDDKELVWYDFEQDNMEDIHIHDLPEIFFTYICVEGLVPVNWESENDGKKQHEQEEHKKIGKKRMREQCSDGDASA